MISNENPSPVDYGIEILDSGAHTLRDPGLSPQRGRWLPALRVSGKEGSMQGPKPNR